MIFSLSPNNKIITILITKVHSHECITILTSTFFSFGLYRCIINILFSFSVKKFVFHIPHLPQLLQQISYVSITHVFKYFHHITNHQQPPSPLNFTSPAALVYFNRFSCHHIQHVSSLLWGHIHLLVMYHHIAKT